MLSKYWTPILRSNFKFFLWEIFKISVEITDFPIPKNCKLLPWLNMIMWTLLYLHKTVWNDVKTKKIFYVKLFIKNFHELRISRNGSPILIKNSFLLSFTTVYEVRKWPKFWSYCFNLMELHMFIYIEGIRLQNLPLWMIFSNENVNKPTQL